MPSQRQLLALPGASRRIYLASGTQAILETTVLEARSLIGAHQGAAGLIGPDGRRVAQAHSLSDKYAGARELEEAPIAAAAFDRLRQDPDPIRLTSAEIELDPAWGDFAMESERRSPAGGWLGAPLIGRGGEVLGMVHLSDPYSGEFTPGDAATLMQLGRSAALALESARLLEETRAAEARLRRFFDTTNDFVCVVALDGRFLEASPNVAAILLRQPEELIGRPFMEFVHPDDMQRSLDRLGSLSADKPMHGFRNRYLRPDGSAVHLQWSATLYPLEGSAYCVARDISEQIDLEAKLNRAQRLEAIGKLTGGIAHDFNNLLTVILGSAECLADEVKDDPSLSELAELIRGAGERGAALTSRLLAYARRQPLEPRPVDMAELVNAVEPLVRRAIGEDIEVAFTPAPGASPCHADAAQLESALLNLCVNARDAMPGGGRLSVEIADVTLNEAEAEAHEGLHAGQYVMMAVTDTGHGMSRETIDHAFDPFFTTKPAGQGSGLGLSQVYGFIHQSGGFVRIESEVGVGTTVRLYLPAAGAIGAIEPEVAEPRAPGGDEHVLVVEDDDLVRAQVRRQLESLGYRVTAAPGAAGALRALDEASDIALLFTDVVMPEMNGRQLADHARLLRPELKVLFTSGYTEDAIVTKGQSARRAQLLRKPYRKVDLAMKVREVLDAD